MLVELCFCITEEACCDCDISMRETAPNLAPACGLGCLPTLISLHQPATHAAAAACPPRLAPPPSPLLHSLPPHSAPHPPRSLRFLRQRLRPTPPLAIHRPSPTEIPNSRSHAYHGQRVIQSVGFWRWVHGDGAGRGEDPVTGEAARGGAPQDRGAQDQVCGWARKIHDSAIHLQPGFVEAVIVLTDQHVVE